MGTAVRQPMWSVPPPSSGSEHGLLILLLITSAHATLLLNTQVQHPEHSATVQISIHDHRGSVTQQLQQQLYGNGHDSYTLGGASRMSNALGLRFALADRLVRNSLWELSANKLLNVLLRIPGLNETQYTVQAAMGDTPQEVAYSALTGAYLPDHHQVYLKPNHVARATAWFKTQMQANGVLGPTQGTIPRAFPSILPQTSRCCTGSPSQSRIRACSSFIRDDTLQLAHSAGWQNTELRQQLDVLLRVAERAAGDSESASFLKSSATFTTESVQKWIRLASAPWVRTICEIGLNWGASAFVFLQSTEHFESPPKLYSFDLFELPYSRAIKEFLEIRFPGRLQVVVGDSQRTVPEFVEARPDVKCDLMLVDGAHGYLEAYMDLKNMMALAACNNILIMDDCNCLAPNAPETLAWRGAVEDGLVTEMDAWHYDEVSVKTKWHSIDKEERHTCCVGRYRGGS